MVEIIRECNTLREIQSAQGGAGVFKDDVLKKWLQSHNPSEFDYAVVYDDFLSDHFVFRQCTTFCVHALAGVWVHTCWELAIVTTIIFLLHDVDMCFILISANISAIGKWLADFDGKSALFMDTWYGLLQRSSTVHIHTGYGICD